MNIYVLLLPGRGLERCGYLSNNEGELKRGSSWPRGATRVLCVYLLQRADSEASKKRRPCPTPIYLYRRRAEGGAFSCPEPGKIKIKELRSGDRNTTTARPWDRNCRRLRVRARRRGTDEHGSRGDEGDSGILRKTTETEAQ